MHSTLCMHAYIQVYMHVRLCMLAISSSRNYWLYNAACVKLSQLLGRPRPVRFSATEPDDIQEDGSVSKAIEME